MDQIRKIKSFFREPKSSRDLDSALEDYSRKARTGNGALLLSVIGGKMSEGINFADDMARCVVVVGLPYPDITDPELIEKMTSLDKKKHSSEGNGITGQTYYHNLCMRAVNQSIGRAIRHGNDYAAVILADARYASEERVWQGLPTWLRGDDRKQSTSFGQTMLDLGTFFKQRKQTS
jgi:chromosome transmission fidelity protein 1